MQIPEEPYMAILKDCKNYLHGRIMLAKGNKPLTHLDMCKKSNLAWKCLGSSKVIPLGKGFSFTSLEDMRCALAVESWILSPGYFCKYLPRLKTFSSNYEAYYKA